MPLPLTGPTLAAYNNLPAIPPEEPLGDLLNSIGAGGALGAACLVDTVVGPAGVPLAATITQTGVYFVQLVAVLDVVGATPADGALLNNANSGGLALASTEYFRTAFKSATNVFFGQIAVGAPLFIFTEGIPVTYVKLEGFINVTSPGVLSFSAGIFGAPTSVTLKAGSGLSVTPIG